MPWNHGWTPNRSTVSSVSSQPTLHPLKGTRSILESLARWSGQGDATAYDILRSLVGGTRSRPVPVSRWRALLISGTGRFTTGSWK